MFGRVMEGTPSSDMSSQCRSRMISPAQQPKLPHADESSWGKSQRCRCSMNGRKQTDSCSPGGRSFSNLVHERGQRSRSRQ